MKPLVAIIVPVFNVEKHITRCANSLFSQTFNAIEYFFIDDASTDRSIELVQLALNQYPERRNQVTILQNTTNIGAAATRHKGILQTNCEYILMIDADDYIDSIMVEELVNVAQTQNADIVVSDIFIEYENKTELYENHISDNKFHNIAGLLTETTVSPSLCSKLIKRSLFLNKECTHNQKLIYHEDKYLFLKILYTDNKITQIPKAFYHYIQYNSNSVTKIITEKYFENVILFWQITEQFLTEKNCIDEFRNNIDYAKVKQKAALLIGTHDIQLRKKFAYIYNDIENIYIKSLRFGEKTMLMLIRFKLYRLSQCLHNLLLLKNKKAFYFNNRIYSLKKTSYVRI